MSIKKTVAVAAAAGALTAVAMPAMAFESEVHGIYNLRTIMSNVENGGTAALDITKYGKNNKANNFMEQRVRLQYSAKANDDLKLVTQFELDTKFGGDKTGKYGVSSDAGVFDADGIMLETKHAYLDFNLGKSVNVKTGIQPIKDSIKGIFVDADVAGITATAKMAPLTLAAGYYRVATDSSNGITQPATTSYFAGNNAIGHENTDLVMLDAKFAASKNINVGGGYYLLSNYGVAPFFTYHVFNVNADAKVGPATVSGFFAAQTGYDGAGATRKAASGYAANVAAKLALGPGTLKTGALFTSGDGNKANGNNTQWHNTGFTTYTEGGMMLLVRTGVGGTTNDRNIIHAAGAGNNGLWLYTLGYDANITSKFFANGNVGFAWVAKNPTGGANGTNFIGTEINLETGYKLYDNLTAKVQGAYIILGGIYDKSNAATQTPENPYTARVVLNYAF